ncbi:uncharacterized protein LOC129951535 isoform X2 [Eupeodes corollae]|uniref:uncharacterized protein LOC129951535 isoform X2 n=1 Tax=Eupeodes corollae TaxID=290404 RepID=UPI0024926182|nr:uncharacterized protein LOC129951535 isoform X2 [Eupeodes corollae]
MASFCFVSIRFKCDLRKLIKYEESLGVDVHQKNYFDNLYRKTTASFRAKIDADENSGLDQKRDREVAGENNLKRKAVGVVEKQGEREQKGGKSGGVSALRDQKQHQQQKQNLPKPQKPNFKEDNTAGTKMTMTATSSKRRNAPTTTTAQKSTAGTSTARSSRATEKSSNSMWIRPRSKTPHAAHNTRMDPVQLYQYYQHEWDKFKTNLPGECNRSELRWQIRHKLLGEP